MNLIADKLQRAICAVGFTNLAAFTASRFVKHLSKESAKQWVLLYDFFF